MKIVKKALVLLLSLLLLSGCVGNNNQRIYASYTVYPIGYLLNKIGGSKINPYSVQNNVIVQKAKMNDDAMDKINQSQYFFHIGKLEPYLDIYLDDIKNDGVSVVDLSSLNSIYEYKRYNLVIVNGKETYIEEPFYDGDCFNTIDTYDKDLFLWLDPIGMLSMAKDIYQTLSSNYVEESELFTTNYQKLEEELITLDASYQNLASSLKSKNVQIKFVSMTASFTSWQKAYGFGIYPVCLSKYGTLPTSEQLEIIKKRIKDDGVEYIAYEPNMSDDMNELFTTLEQELGLKRINLNNISSLTQSQVTDGSDYLSLMYENLRTLESIASTLTTDTSNIVDTTEENTVDGNDIVSNITENIDDEFEIYSVED